VNLILLEEYELNQGTRVVLSDHRAEHILATLKARPGSTVRIGLVNGPMGIGTVMDASAHQVELDCRFDAEVAPGPAVDLLLALPRPKVMRRLWAPLASLGVGRIMLTNAWKVERNYFDTHVLEPQTYRPLLLEGLQQARDTRLPEVSIHRQFKKLVEDELDALCPNSTRLVADPAAKGRIHDILSPSEDTRILLAVGPEGGWTDYERELLMQHRFRPVGMGTRILRTDTACIALLALVHDALQVEGEKHRTSNLEHRTSK
jgi:16S rRNA (uracil1498-N3)-methyltransferase